MIFLAFPFARSKNEVLLEIKLQKERLNARPLKIKLIYVTTLMKFNFVFNIFFLSKHSWLGCYKSVNVDDHDDTCVDDDDDDDVFIGLISCVS